MENHAQTQTVPVKPPESFPFFPPHRRRPIRSRTLHTLVQILSHCSGDSLNLQSQGDEEGSEYRQVTVANGLINNDAVKPMDEVVVGESDATSVQATVSSEIIENIGFPDAGLDLEQVTTSKLDCINLVIDGEHNANQENYSNVGENLVHGSESGGRSVENVGNLEKVKDILDFQMDDFGQIGSLDQEFSIQEFSDVLESCFGMDMGIEPSNLGKDGRGNGSALEENVSKEVHNQLQLKEMELGELISSVAVGSSLRYAADEDIEEGEISGEAGVANELLDALSEEALSLKDEMRKMANASEDNVGKERGTVNYVESGRYSQDFYDSPIINMENNEKGSVDRGVGAAAKQVQNSYSRNLFGNNYLDTLGTDLKATSSEKHPPTAQIAQGNAAENQISPTTEKDGSHRRKRKKGPMTEERRAKKKQKDRLKRAEKNRKLGVKRLKLQPVMKTKTITYCRHYLQGRCHEGEKCKFSHDTVPLTKSKPCSHFVRRCCMKGDDCPFDHQLSKYPCKNFALRGFCTRGSDCLFSHEILASQSSPVTPNISKPEESEWPRMSKKEGSIAISRTNLPESKFQTPLNQSNTLRQTNGLQNADIRFCAANKSPVKGTEQLSLKNDPRTIMKAPRGVNFLLNAGTSISGIINNILDGSSTKAGDDIDVREKILEVTGDGKSNGVSEGSAPKRPRGINFLSFAQSSLESSSCKKSSDVFSERPNEKGKSAIDYLTGGKETCSSPERRETMTSNKMVDQSANGVIHLLNQEATRTPTATLSQHIKFPYLDKSQVDSSIFKEPANCHLKKDERPLPLAQDRQNMMIISQDTSKMPSMSYDVPNKNLSTTSTKPFMLNTSSLVQKAVQSTLAFAAKFDRGIKLDSSDGNSTSS